MDFLEISEIERKLREKMYKDFKEKLEKNQSLPLETLVQMYYATNIEDLTNRLDALIIVMRGIRDEIMECNAK